LKRQEQLEKMIEIHAWRMWLQALSSIYAQYDRERRRVSNSYSNRINAGMGVNIFTLVIIVYNIFELAIQGYWTWENWIVFLNIVIWDALILLVYFRYEVEEK